VAARDALTLEIEGLLYALDAPPRVGRKTAVSVRVPAGEAAPFAQMCELYGFRGRQRLARAVAERFGRDPGKILGHLALLMDQVERAEASAKPASEPVAVTDSRRAEAERLLAAPDLLDRAANQLTALGYVGEEANKRLVYLVATSRLLVRPLSAILMAPSGAGKSELLDKLALLLPPESVEYLSRLTASALYYAGTDHLRHKVVIVDEQEGAVEADYAIRTLQSKGYLRLAAPVHGRTESLEARGPIALLSGTTRTDLNAENLSRCLELALDDSAEQTRRIQEAQRSAWAGTAAPPADLMVWQDAQRLLEPAEVVIPFAPRLAFPARTTKDRRDQQKLLSLVAAHALLHQRQRERDAARRVVAIVADYAAVHALLASELARATDGLSPRAARVYRLLAEAGVPLSRREIAERVGWNYMTSARALNELAEQELVAVSKREQPKRYALGASIRSRHSRHAPLGRHAGGSPVG
jgi:DNA primase